MIQKGKVSLYSSQNYIQLQSVVSSITSWKYTVQAVPSKKKKNLKREGGKENKMDEGERKERGGKEEKKKKGMERVCAEGKGKGRMRCGRKEERKEKRMKEKEKEKKGEEEKEEQKIERATQEMHRPLRTHSLARS